MSSSSTKTSTRRRSLRLLSSPSPSTQPRRLSLRQRRHESLAHAIVNQHKRVLIVTGAGVSVESGVQPFRGSSSAGALWSSVVYSTATRQAFRKDPLKWYNCFWLPHFGQTTARQHEPNAAHLALAELSDMFPNVRLITQNIDGLHSTLHNNNTNNVIEAHGRVGLYKCIPDVDSDSDSDEDDDDDRPVHLGHRRKQKLQQPKCPYQYQASLTAAQLEPAHVRQELQQCEQQREQQQLSAPPKCPNCARPCLPQALLFDEGYHSHSHYQFRQMEQLLSEAQVLVFCGTSFAVHLTEVALEHARSHQLPVYNFNTHDTLDAKTRLNVVNIVGPSHKTLPQLVDYCKSMM